MGTSFSGKPHFFVIVLASVLAAAVTVWIGIGGILSGLGVGNLPYDLVVLRAREPVAFPMHMVAGGAGLLLALCAIAAWRFPVVHRPLGYSAVGFLAIAALAAVPTALSSLAAPLARAGFLAQGCVCLACLALGWWAIRQRRIIQHRRMMAAAAATAFGAVVLRALLIGIDVAGLPHAPAYAAAAWLAWLLPLAAVLAWLRTPT